MRFVKVAVLALAVAALCAPAFAEGVQDPQIIIRSGGGGTINITSLPFNVDPALVAVTPNQNNVFDCWAATFTVGTGTLPGYTCVFQNETGAPLTGLAFTFGGSQGPLFGGGDIFGAWHQNGDAVIYFTGGAIAPGQEFFIDFVGFQPGTTFDVAPVPEPATLALVGSGLAAIAIRRRRKK